MTNDPFSSAVASVYGTGEQDQQDTTTPAPTGHSKDKKSIAQHADAQANGQDENMSAGDYAWDAAVGVASGAEGFAKSIGKLGNDVAGMFGHKFTDDSTFDQSIHTKSWVGGLTSGITQFALAFLPAVGVAGRIGTAVGITSKLAQGLAAGAAADFLAFNEKQQRLSNLVQSFPALQNPVTDFLSSKPDDNFAEGRLKSSLEGLGLGLIAHPLFEGLKGFKSLMIAKAAGDPEAAAKVSNQVAQNVADAMKTANKAAVAANVTESVAGAVDGAKLSGTAGKLGNDSLRSGVPDYIVDKIVDHISTSPQPFDVALNQAVESHINFDRLITSQDVEGLHKLALNVSERFFQKVSGGVMGLDLVRDTADQLADIYGQSPKLMFSSSAADQTAIKNMGVRLVAYRIQRNAIGQSLVNAANGILGGTEEESGRLMNLARAYANIHNSVQLIQKEGARIPSFGRVEADTLINSFDPDKLASVVDKVMNGAQGAAAKEQLVRTIVASQADPKSMMTLFDGLMKRAGGKAVGILNEFHVNAMLSAPATGMKKFLSDTFNAVVLPTERLLGGAMTQNNAVMRSGWRMYQNILTSFLDWTHLSEGASRISDQYGSSLGRAWKAALGEQPLLDHLSEFDRPASITAQNVGLKEGSMLGNAVNFMGKTIRMPQRLLVGMDQFWKDVNYRAYIRDEGMRLADAQGITDPAAYGQFISDHITQSFTEDGRAANDAAMGYAKAATFQNDLLPGTLGKWVQDGVNEHPALRMILPFVKTPTNIFRRAWQMTPGLNLLQGEFRQLMSSADPIVRSEAMGRMGLGGMLWTLGVGMAASEKLTGGGPSKPAERNALLDSGWQPYSFVTTGPDGKKQYISYKSVEPFAYFLSLASDWKEAVGQVSDDDAEKMGTGMMYALAKNLSSKTYMTGLTQLVNALAAPDQQIQRYINQFAGSWVPSLFAKADPDDYMREASTMMDAVRRRIPGLSDSLPPVRNILGEPVQAPAGWLPFGGEDTAAARTLSPFAYSKEVGDPVKDEIAKLQYGFSKAPKSLKGFDLSLFHNKDGQDAYDRFQQLHGTVLAGGKTMGQSLTDLINSKRYQSFSMPDRHGDDTNQRVQAVQAVIASYRNRAMQQTLREYPQIGNAIRTYQQQNTSPSPLSALAVR